jgi:uncharacterized protein YecE (DUF72 family)
MSAIIKTGISAWTEKTLVESGWYPKEANSPEARLRYYASRFPIVENDATHYALPPARQGELWSERTPHGFTMNVKAFGALTAHYVDAKRLPVDIRQSLPGAARESQRVYPKDLGGEILLELARRFRDALRPLHESGKLGLVLFQYPVWFPIGKESKQQILRARELFPDYRLAVEFRNSTWMSDRNREETLLFLADHGIAYTCVDEPQGFASSVPPIAAATSDVALVRLHGRNAATWSKAVESAWQRFDYRYSVEELRAWVPKIQALAAATREVHVILNNCHADYAVTNAAELAALLDAA